MRDTLRLMFAGACLLAMNSTIGAVGTMAVMLFVTSYMEMERLRE
jgi:hypothetical protein